MPVVKRLAAFLRLVRARAGAAALAACTVATARADAGGAVFQIDDTPGEIHLSDRADAAPGATVRRIAGTSAPPAALPARAAGLAPLATIVRDAALRERLSPALIDAVIAVESAWRVRAVSPRGASGLMQLMPATARAYGVTDIFDPRQNIDAGARHLRGLLDRYGQDVSRALAAYNAGAGVADHAATSHDGWPAETASYVPQVLARLAPTLTP